MKHLTTAVVVLLTLAAAAACASADELTFCNYIPASTLTVSNTAVSGEASAPTGFGRCTVLTYTAATTLAVSLEQGGSSLATLSFTPAATRSERRVFAFLSTDSTTATLADGTSLTSLNIGLPSSPTLVKVALINAAVAIPAPGATFSVGVSTGATAYLSSTSISVSADQTLSFVATDPSDNTLATTTISSATLKANEGKIVVAVLGGRPGAYSFSTTNEAGVVAGSSGTSSPAARPHPLAAAVAAAAFAAALLALVFA